MDRLKMIMMTQESVKGMSVREGMQQMAAEGVLYQHRLGSLVLRFNNPVACFIEMSVSVWPLPCQAQTIAWV